MFESPLAVGGIVLALALGAGVLPLLFRFGPRAMHAIVAASCGFFLGITFLHLLPEIANRSSSTLVWGCVLGGLLGVFLIELLLRTEEEHHDHDHPAHHGGHRVVGIATFLGLSVHTLGGALGIGLSFDDEHARDAFVMATLAHKPPEAFSLVTVLLLAEMRRRSIYWLLGAYALVTPVGILLGRLLHGWMQRSVLDPAEGLAAGTFLYVAIAELLPEVFHGHRDRLVKTLLLGAGIAASTLILLGHDHPRPP